MSKRFEVYSFGSLRFEGNAEEFRRFLIEFYTSRFNSALKNLDKVQNIDASELGEFASREDCWSIEETPEFFNHPRIKA